jgi:hypothetical protein
MITIHKLIFKVPSASLQTFIDTKLTLTPSVIPNSNYVIMVSDWNCLKYFACFFCTVIIRCTETFWSLFTLSCLFVCHAGTEGRQRYSSTVSLTSALEGCGRSAPRPGRCTLGKGIRYALYRRLGGPRVRCACVREISPSPRFESGTAQPVASRRTVLSYAGLKYA